MKVKFKDPMPDETTKGESLEYTTVSIEGDASVLKNGDWSISKTFTDYDEASKFLDEKLTGSTPSV